MNSITKLLEPLTTLIIISVLTILTQVGGLVYLCSLALAKTLPLFKQANVKLKQLIIFIGCYLLTTFVVVPLTSGFRLS